MTEARIRDILSAVKPLAAEYYQITGKPLGVTGEIAEVAAAEALGLELAPARTAGYDAIRRTPHGDELIQIKARALSKTPKPGQRLGRIKPDAFCHKVLLVLLSIETLDLLEIWEADFTKVLERLSAPGSVARNERGALGLRDFKKVATKVWPVEQAEPSVTTR